MESKQGVDLQLGGWGRCQQLLTIKTYLVTKCLHIKTRTQTYILVRPKQQKTGMTFGTWNVRSLYRSGSLTAAVRELARYKLELVGVEEVMWDKGCTARTWDYKFFYGKGNKYQLGTEFFCTAQKYIST